MKIAIAIGALVIAATVVACLAPLVPVPYEVTVDYQDTETYYEDEPYEETETYTETVSLDYEVVDTDVDVEGQSITVSVALRNTDDVAGIFTVELYVIYDCTIIAPGSIYIGPKYVSDHQELPLDPHGARTATLAADNPYPTSCAFDSWSYDVTPSTKELENERIVTRQRQETRYKKVPLVEYLRYYR